MELMVLQPKPIVFVIGPTALTRQWVGILGGNGVSCRAILSVNAIELEASTPGPLFLIVGSDSERDAFHVCLRWLTDGGDRPLLLAPSAPEMLCVRKRIVWPQLEIVDISQSIEALISRLQLASLKDVENRRLRQFWSQISEKFRGITAKEREVLDRLLKGLSNKSIAECLLITERAVEMRRATLMRKLQVDSHAALIQLATRHEVFITHGLLLPTE